MEYALILADILSALSVVLMLFVLKSNIKHEKRIQKMEEELYPNLEDPMSIPLTQQVHNLQEDMTEIKKGFEKLNKMVAHFAD